MPPCYFHSHPLQLLDSPNHLGRLGIGLAPGFFLQLVRLGEPVDHVARQHRLARQAVVVDGDLFLAAGGDAPVPLREDEHVQLEDVGVVRRFLDESVEDGNLVGES